MAKMKTLELLELLTREVEQARRVPLVNKVLVDPDHILELIDDIRMQLPDELKRAERILAERGALIERAEKDAERIRGQARARGSAAPGDADIAATAREEARRMIEEAKSLALEVRSEAEGYARDLLRDLESTLEKAIRVVRRGLEELEGTPEKRESVQH